MATALVALAAIILASRAADELTEHHARVLRAAVRAIEHGGIAYRAMLAEQDTPHALGD